MRFVESGPIIPDDLLFAQDEGQVVFFCGSGVSKARVGLPDFTGLTKDVLDNLRATDDSAARRLFSLLQQLQSDPNIRGFSSADRVFGLLTRDFAGNDINRSVAQSLRSLENSDLSTHKIMLRLASLPGGKTRIITTNFDLLFEACNRKLKSVTRSNLPRIQFVDNDWGVIHLHGCVKPDYSGHCHVNRPGL